MEVSYAKLVTIFENSFNGQYDFKSWSKKKFLKFVKDFISNKTEYFMDDYFIKRYLDKVKKLLGEINGTR